MIKYQYFFPYFSIYLLIFSSFSLFLGYLGPSSKSIPHSQQVRRKPFYLRLFMIIIIDELFLFYSIRKSFRLINSLVSIWNRHQMISKTRFGIWSCSRWKYSLSIELFNHSSLPFAVLATTWKGFGTVVLGCADQWCADRPQILNLCCL